MDRTLDDLIRFLLEQIALRGKIGMPRSVFVQCVECLGSNPPFALIMVFKIVILLFPDTNLSRAVIFFCFEGARQGEFARAPSKSFLKFKIHWP